MKTKPWEKPQLIVLVKGKPEEGVLQICKIAPLPPIGPGAKNNGCYWDIGFCAECSQYIGT